MWVGLNMLMGLISHNSDNCEHIVSARFINSFCCHHLPSLVWICGLLHVPVSLKLRICLSFHGANDAKNSSTAILLDHMHTSDSTSMSSIPESCHSSCWNYKKSSQTVRNNNNSISFAVLELPSSSVFM